MKKSQLLVVSAMAAVLSMPLVLNVLYTVYIGSASPAFGDNNRWP